MKSTLSYFVFCLLLAVRTPAQVLYTDSRYTVEAAGENENLKPWYFTLTDRNNMLWVTTINTLSRYDGSLFTHYTTTDGLPQQPITQLLKDTADELYISTLHSISRFTGKGTLKFASYPPLHDSLFLISFCAVNRNLLYAVCGNGQRLFRYTGKWQLIDLPGSFYSLSVDKHGAAYALTQDNKLYYINDTSPGLLHQEKEQPTCLLNTGPDDDAYFYNYKALYRLSPQGLTKVQELPDTLHAWQIITTGISKGAGFLLADSSRLSLADKSSTRTVCISSNDAFSKILSMCREEGGAAYFTDRSLFKLRAKSDIPDAAPLFPNKNYVYNSTKAGERFRSPAEPAVINALSPKDRKKLDSLATGYRYLYRDAGDTVWVCSNRGLFTLNGGMRLRYLPPPLYYSVHDSTFHNITETTDGSLWIASFNGLIRYRQGVFKMYPLADYNPHANTIYNTSVNKRGDILLGTGTGLYALQNEKPAYLSGLLRLPESVIQQLVSMPNGKTWVNILNKKIYGIMPEGATGFKLTDSLNVTLGKDFMNVRAMQRDAAGNLWIYANEKLIAFLCDKEGNLNSEHRVVFTTADGIPDWKSAKTTLFVLSRQEDGKMRFEKKDSVVIFDPQRLLSRPEPKLPVLLTGLLLNRLPANWDSLGFDANTFNVPQNAAFRNTQNNFTFEFAAVDHRHPEYIIYRYRLAGNEDEWQPVTKLRFAEYNNLPPGRYTFYLEASGINGGWHAALPYSFTINEPWYKTTAAYIVWSILLLGAIIILTQLRINYIRKKESVARIITEQKLKALRAQINPHFLQNTFGFLSQSMEENSREETQEIIIALSGYLRNILYLSDQSVLTLESELEFAEEYLTISRMLFNDSFRFNVNIESDVDTFKIKVPSMLLQPILENALKHGVSHAEGHDSEINLHVWKDAQFTYCVISNTIAVHTEKEAAAGYKPKGLNITEERLKLLFAGRKKAFIRDSVQHNFYIVTIGLPV